MRFLGGKTLSSGAKKGTFTLNLISINFPLIGIWGALQEGPSTIAKYSQTAQNVISTFYGAYKKEILVSKLGHSLS